MDLLLGLLSPSMPATLPLDTVQRPFVLGNGHTLPEGVTIWTVMDSDRSRHLRLTLSSAAMSAHDIGVGLHRID